MLHVCGIYQHLQFEKGFTKRKIPETRRTRPQLASRMTENQPARFHWNIIVKCHRVMQRKR